MTLDEFRSELEKLLADLSESGFDCMRRVHTPPLGAKKGYVPGDKYLTKTTYPAACGGVVDSVDAALTAKMELLISAAAELGMNEGRHLLENLLGAVKAIFEGKSKAESGEVRLTALEFYVKKLSDAAENSIEEL